MYESFYGLTHKPFNLTPDPDFLYLSRAHEEGLAHLTYGVESRSGFVLVTGEVGAGKTTLLRKLIRDLGDQVLLSQVTNTRVSYLELLELIVRDFGLNPQGLGKTALLSMLNDFLIDRYREGRRCLLLVDEAQNLGTAALDGVRMLSNLETEKTKLLQTILVGQPGLRDLIDSPKLEQLRQRISVRYHLGPLTAEEVGEYVRFRLGKVSADPARAPAFSDEVLRLLHQASGGIPRLVNLLCDAALLHGYVDDRREIGADMLLAAVQARQGEEEAPPPAEHREPRRAGSGTAELRERLARLEARVEQLADDARQRPVEPPLAREWVAREAALSVREAQLSAKEVELTARTAELKRRETELERRLALARERWANLLRQAKQKGG